MFIPLETALAVALLIAPAEPIDVGFSPGSLTHLLSTRQSVQTLAVEWELLDPREVKFVLTQGDAFTFESDLRFLRRRMSDMEGAPLLSSAFQLPTREAVNELLEFNRAYRKNIEQRQLYDHPLLWWEYEEVLREVDWAYQIWDLVRDARCEYYYVTVRRQALKKLHSHLKGWGEGLPPHVPIWRFIQIH